MIKVYIASPYTIGDVAVNVKLQIDTADMLMDKGFAPFCPLYSHFQHMAHPRDYHDWINVDFEWVRACDCLLRLGGESKGADGEVALAKEIRIPVFYSIDELSTFYSVINECKVQDDIWPSRFWNVDRSYYIDLSGKDDYEETIAIQEFKNVGDEGLFPNHSDKDIWISGFKSAIAWIRNSITRS